MRGNVAGVSLLNPPQSVDARIWRASQPRWLPDVCNSAPNFVGCLQNHGIRMSVTYQPASRYWEFQWLETGTFLVLAAGLGGVCYWRVRRRA
jgi:hypothetical protein